MNRTKEIGDLLLSILGNTSLPLVISDKTALLGAIPEFDSMAVIALVTALEEHYDIQFDDDELTADSFATIGKLASLVQFKIAESST